MQCLTKSLRWKNYKAANSSSCLFLPYGTLFPISLCCLWSLPICTSDLDQPETTKPKYGHVSFAEIAFLSRHKNNEKPSLKLHLGSKRWEMYSTVMTFEEWSPCWREILASGNWIFYDWIGLPFACQNKDWIAENYEKSIPEHGDACRFFYLCQRLYFGDWWCISNESRLYIVEGELN